MTKRSKTNARSTRLDPENFIDFTTNYGNCGSPVVEIYGPSFACAWDAAPILMGYRACFLIQKPLPQRCALNRFRAELFLAFVIFGDEQACTATELVHGFGEAAQLAVFRGGIGDVPTDLDELSDCRSLLEHEIHFA